MAEMCEEERLERLVHLAKLEASELMPMSQMLHFDTASNHVLMQVDETLLEQIVKEEKVWIRGDVDDCVVLCTSNKSYDVKEAETSNSLLVVPDLVVPDANKAVNMSSVETLRKVNVSKVIHTYLETKLLSRPSLNKLFTLLSSKCLVEDKFGFEDTNLDKGIDMDTLLNTIQASQEELETELRQLHAVHMEGKYYLLDTDYETKLVSYITNLMYENDWSATSVPLEETLDTLSELEPRALLSQIFSFYFDSNPVNLRHNTLKHQELSRIHGLFLLERGSEFVYDDFMQTWQASLPEGTTADISHLRGLALVDNNHIRLFREQKLPESVSSRLQVLFKVKAKWTLKEIEPFVEKVAGKPGVKAVMAKHARNVNDGASQYFMAKHAS